jgi:hypothetical protein
MRRCIWIPILALAVAACRDGLVTNPIETPALETVLSVTADPASEGCYQVSLPIVVEPWDCSAWPTCWLTATVTGDIVADLEGPVIGESFTDRTSKWTGEITWTLTSSTIPNLGETLKWSVILFIMDAGSPDARHEKTFGQNFLIEGARSGHLIGRNDRLEGRICP